MDFSTKMRQYTGGLTAPERRFIAAVMRQAGTIRNKRDRHRITETLADLAGSYVRASYRRSRDKARDSQQRTLIGARLKREEVERYKAIAEQTQRSLYAFVQDALQAEAARCEPGRTEAKTPDQAQDIDWQPMTASICRFETRVFPGDKPS